MTGKTVGYQEPPVHVCDVRDYPVDLPATIPGTHTLNVNLWFYRRQVRRFSLEQVIWIDDAWHKILRWDTAHGVVHRHRFSWGGHTADRENVEELPDNALAAVKRIDYWYDRAYDEIIENAHTELERWINVNRP